MIFSAQAKSRLERKMKARPEARTALFFRFIDVGQH
jgi:hypothetical protein